MTQIDNPGKGPDPTEEEDPRQMADIFGDPSDRSTSELKHCDNNNKSASSPTPSHATSTTSEIRTRKVSHRKVIIHNDGEICGRTYNKICPHDDDPDMNDPPMHHELDGESMYNTVCLSYAPYKSIYSIDPLKIIGNA